MVCSCSGIFGPSASGFNNCCFRNAFAATLRCFLDLENRSPSSTPAPESLLAEDCSRTVHNHGGYSLSSNATGSCFPLRKFNPLSGVPATTELFTSTGGVDVFGGPGRFCFLGGDDDRGVLNGCAAPVDVAAGGLCEDCGEPCRGAAGVAEESVADRGDEVDTHRDCIRRLEVVVPQGDAASSLGEERRAARIHLLQIISISAY